MKLNYTIEGTGKAIILIHGLFGSGDNLRRLSHALSKNYMVISPDPVSYTHLRAHET